MADQNDQLYSNLKQICCEFCLKDLTRGTYLNCAKCVNFYFCVSCFTKGCEKVNHTRFHPYYLIDPNKFPLFVSNWTSREEQLLLENILKLRYGNWGLISEVLNASKSPLECELHYKQVYLNKTVADLQDYEVLSYKDEQGIVHEKKVSNLAKFNQIIYTADEPYAPHLEKKSEFDGFLNDFAGFWPLRRDFDLEYENDIENYIADLEFFDDDRPEDINIKLKQLEVYCKILDEREERKNFVMERWPLEVKTEKKFKNNVIEKNVYCSLKPFARLLPFDKHVSFCEALIKENLFKLKLEELKEARNKGIKTEEDFKKFLNQKKNIFTQKAKEYEILIKDTFAYKLAENQKNEVVRVLEQEKGRENIEEEFFQRIGISQEQFIALKDKISGNLQPRLFQGIDENCEETEKKEFIDFVVKPKSN